MLNQATTKTILDAKVIIRAVLYARVSGDDTKKEGRNIQSQLDMGREYATEKGYQVIKELSEDDKKLTSGADWNLPALNEALEMARNGEFDVLIIRELDRFARSLAKQLVIEKQFKQAGVEVEYVLEKYDDTPEGQLSKHVRAVIAEYERVKITQRAHRGKKNKVKAGNVITAGISPYGYRQVDNQLEIYELEAEIVRLIYRWYVEDELTYHKIKRKLDNLDAPLPVNKGKPHGKTRVRKGWSISTIRNILKNETYAGIWHYGKKGNAKEMWLEVEITPIISRELWEMAQEQRKTNRAKSKRNRKYDYLLANRIKCGICGYSVIGTSLTRPSKVYLYYGCNCKKDFPVDCNLPYYRADKVDKLIWDWLKELFTQSDEVLYEGLKTYQQEQSKQNEPVLNEMALIDDMIADNQKRLQRNLMLFESGEFEIEDLLPRKRELETKIKALQTERKKLTQLLKGVMTDETINSILEFAAKIRQGLSGMEDDFEQRRGLVEDLDLRVRFYLEDGTKKADAMCVLGSKTLSVDYNTAHNAASHIWPMA